MAEERCEKHVRNPEQLRLRVWCDEVVELRPSEALLPMSRSNCRRVERKDEVSVDTVSPWLLVVIADRGRFCDSQTRITFLLTFPFGCSGRAITDI